MAQTVIQHLLEELKKIGISDIFGIPGDYAFPVNDAICNDPELRWVGCCNELNAAFAADGYARVHGAAALCTTYGVGELSAINGIAGAYAENLPIFHIVGAPAHAVQMRRGVLHHTLGNGDFDLFYKMTQPVVCASTMLTPENTIAETERVIRAALEQKRPVYIAIAGDFATTELSCQQPYKMPKPESDPKTLVTAVAAIMERLEQASQPVAMVGSLVGRYKLQEETQQLVETAGLPFSTLFMGKGTLSEKHPNFIGVYNGRLVAEDVCTFMESSDLVLSIGTICSDINTGAFTTNIDPANEIRIRPDHTLVGRAVYPNILMRDVIAELNTRLGSGKHRIPIQPFGLGEPVGKPDDEISPDSLYPRLERFFEPNDIIIGETGTPSMGLVNSRLPEGAVFHNQTLWGSIGWATPASFGAAIAAPGKRVILITGEGSHQMTVQEISQFERYGLKPIIFCVNNDGYLIERLLCINPDIYYNDIAQWNYSQLPAAFGMENWFCAKVKTNKELDNALVLAANATTGVYIEVVTDKMAAPKMAMNIHEKVVKSGGWE